MEDLFKLKATEIKKRCKDLGLSTLGNKAELTTRLLEHMTKGGDDSVLNEAELLGELDSSDSQVVSNVDEDLLLGDSTIEPREKLNETVSAEETQAIEKPEEIKNNDEVEEPPSKISKPDVSVADMDTSKKIEKSEDGKQDAAARLGVTNSKSEDEKKLLRAQRFGLTSTSNGDTSIDIEKLKKRQERFGGSVSDKLNKVTEDEKKMKRAERFGFQTGVENAVKTGSNEDKKSLRAARFGITADEDKKKARAAKFGN